MENPLRSIPVETFRLSNGLTVFVVPDRAIPLVAVNINYSVGSKDERPGKTGLAHLFEHMMFQGSGHWNDNYNRPLQEVGGTVNGGTSTDRTRYWEVVPAGYLERALWLESDRMGFLLDALTQERLDNQRSVVKNERRQNYENRPYGLVREKITAVLYPPHHPYHWPTIGSMADLDGTTLDDVRTFFRTYYAPNNASLCIAGDVDVAAARELVERLFGEIAPGPPVARPARWTPRLPGEVHLDIEDRVELPRTQMIWHGAPAYSADEPALDLFGRVLGSGKTSRLYRRLVHDLQIAQDGSASHGGAELAGTFSITITPRPGHSLEELEAAACAVLEEMLEDGITAAELERTQVALAADFVKSMENIGGFTGISDRVNEYFHLLREPDRFRWDLQRYLDLGPGQVVEIARAYLGERRLVARVTPLPKLSAAPSRAAGRGALPGRAPENAFALPPRRRLRLSNGLDVLLVEHRKLPVIEAALFIRSGGARDPEGRHGLASMTAGLLTEGAAGRSAQELAERTEALGAELELGAWPDDSMATLSVLKPRAAEAFALLADVVARPDFPDHELERTRQRRLVRFQQLLDAPEYLGGLALARVMFGGHPYGHLSMGSPEGIAAITRDDLQRFWRGHFVPGNATLLVVGDVTPDELMRLLEPSLGTWDGEAADLPPLPDTGPHGPRTIYLVDKPKAPQSMLLVAQPGPPRKTRDHAALELLNAAFGGQFISRLNMNLREEKGYTYGVRSSFDYRHAGGTFSVRAQVETAVTVPALREIVAEFEALAGARPLSAEEITAARGAIVDGYAKRFETPTQIAHELADVVLYGLAEDAPEAFPREVAAATPESLAELARRTLRPDGLALIVVGDVATVRPELEASGLGPVTLL